MKSLIWRTNRLSLRGVCYAFTLLGVLPVGASFAASPVLPAALVVAADQDPNLDPDYLYLQAITQESAKYRTADGSNFRRAIKLYDEALKRRKNFYDALYHKAVCNYYLKNYAGAIGDASKHIELRPDIMQAYVIRAQAYVKKQDYDPALTDLNTVEKNRPDLMEFRLRGQIYYARNTFDKAATDFEKYVLTKTDNKGRVQLDAIVAFLDLGNTYGKIGDNTKAVDAYSRYITAYPDPSTPWAQRGDKDYDDLPFALDKRGSAYLEIARKANDPELPELAQAADDYKKLTELEPQSPSGYIGLGNIALFQKQWDVAVQSLDKAVALAPTNDSALAALSEARRLQSLEKLGANPVAAGTAPSAATSASVAGLQKSIAEQTEALRLNPANVVALRGRGLSNANPVIGNYTQAVADFTQLLAVLPAGDPRVAEAYFNRASVYVTINPPAYDKAIPDFDAAIQADPKNAQAFIGRGDAYASLKQYDKAIADYNVVIDGTGASDAAKLGARLNRAVSYINTTPPKLDEASADLKTYLQVHPDDQKAKDSLFAIELKKGADAQLAALTQRIGEEPNVANNYLLRAAVYDGLKRYDEAIADYQKVTSIDASNKTAYQNLLADYAAKGYDDAANVEGAIAASTKLIALEPTNPTFLLSRGDLYVIQKNFTGSAADYKAAIAQLPAGDAKRTDVQYLLANVYLGAKQDAQAKQAFDDYFVSAPPTHPKYDEALVQRGDLLRASKDYAGAIADYSKFLVNHPTDVTVLKVRGQSYLDSKDEVKALADFEAAVRSAPTDSESLTLVGGLYYEQAARVAGTNPDNAIPLYKKAIDSANRSIAADAASPGAYFYKGVALAENAEIDNLTPADQKAQRQEALAALNKFVELVPADTRAESAKKVIAALTKAIGA